MQDWREAEIAAALDAIYDAAVCPAAWVSVLDTLGGLFRSHFADIFARTDDFSVFKGRAIGLDKSDYEDEFLGVWCNRNIWSQTKPVRIAGEVLSTRQMVDRHELERSSIYNEYLRPRDLDEGLRLALWAGNGWVSDISLLRPSAAGPFEANEIVLGEYLLPHLQRAASSSRKLQGVIGLGAMDGTGQAAFLLDESGRVLQMNAAANDVLEKAGPLKITAGVLTARSDRDAAFLQQAVAAASRIRFAQSAELDMYGTLQPVLRVAVQPVREMSGWGVPGPRAVLVLPTIGRWPAHNPAETLITRYDLTRAEASFALNLVAGKTLSEIAAESGRSIHTVRSHLARVMVKTATRRQSQLVALLLRLDRAPGMAVGG